MLTVERDILPILLRKVDLSRPRVAGKLRSNAKRTLRIVNARWQGWNSVAITMTHTEMVNWLYPRDRPQLNNPKEGS